MDRVSRLAILNLIPQFLTGTQASDPHIDVTRGRWITVQTGESKVLATAARRLSVEVVPQKVRIVV